MKPERPRQEVPAEIIAELMGVIRNQFCPDMDPQKWGQSYHFFRREIVTWPAAWLTSRGVTLSPQRYRQILLGIFQDVKTRGSTDAVKYWPGYLQHCVQQHFAHHGEEYYEEGKSIRAATERGLMAFHRAAQAAPSNDPIQALAQVHAALVSRKRRKIPHKPRQLPLL